MKRLAIILALVTIAACNRAGQEEARTPEGAQSAANAEPTAPPARKSNPLPSGFALPFEYYVRGSRSEPQGNVTKKRVILEIRGLDLKQADEKIAAMAAEQGYVRGQVEQKEGGFSVSYRHPNIRDLRTRFFEGKETKFISKDATGLLHVTWIVRR